MKDLIGKKVIIRAESAGVFFGVLEFINEGATTCRLSKCRRVWKWAGARTLSQLAKEGTKNSEECMFAVAVDDIVITGVIEVIPTTELAASSIEGVDEWKI